MRALLIIFTVFAKVNCKEQFHIDSAIPPTYDRRDLPLKDYPTNVTTQVELNSLGPIDEQTFTFEIDFYHRSWWNDPRLNVHNASTMGNGVKQVVPSGNPGGMIWMPDTVYPNAKKFELASGSRTVISSNGDIYNSRRVMLKCTCSMDLTYYPMDSQNCSVTFESFSFTAIEMRLYWHENIDNLKTAKETLQIDGYQIISMSVRKKVLMYTVGGSLQPWDRLFLDILVSRTFMYYIYRIYVPTLLLMAFNMCSYFVPDTAVPARMTLIVTTFLGSVFILQSVTEKTVKVSYSSSMQIFLLGSVVFLVVSIVEFIIVLYLKDISKPEPKFLRPPSEPHLFTGRSYRSSSDFHNFKLFPNTHHPPPASRKSQKDTVHKVDRMSRIAVPAIYVLFCIFYFGISMSN